MPYRWSVEPGPGTAPPWRLRLWPNRSLSPAGLVAFVAATAALAALPVLALIGRPVVWGLLPFLALVPGLLLWAFGRSRADGRRTEDLVLERDRVELVRREPGGQERRWSAHPRFVFVTLCAEGGPVANYLTLRGGGREVELGAFLAPGERADLHDTLRGALAALR
ncbi:MAG: DUF2244 domain-containing protein [Rhodobacteraceae bacterium]|nr:DUF2244 domain-containing protein [Paracoccaceae bacterium]